MPISLKHNAIFIHIPKNAGTSIEHALGVYGERNCLHGISTKGYMQHWTAQQIKDFLGGDDYFNRFSFSFIRNPWDRLVSEYFYLKKIKDPYVEGVEFEDFARKLPVKLDKTCWHIWQHLRPQIDYIKVKGVEGYGVTYLGQFEFINEQWEEVAEELGIEKSLGKKQVSKHKHYREYYSDETREIVEEVYAKDIEIFDYEF